jgi:hypothetical protein
MTFQAYLDTIKEKTGKAPGDFRALAQEKGLTTRPGLMNWLKADFGLGYGHANLIAGMILHADDPETTTAEDLAAVFIGAKAHWRATYDALFAKVSKFGAGVSAAPTSSYVSLLRNGKKFAIVQPSGNRLDIGIKRKGVPPEGRFEASGKWNAMVTHRVCIQDPKEIDGEMLDWLVQAYRSA